MVRIMPLIPLIATRDNELKEHEMVTRCLDVKLKLDGESFAEQNEVVETNKNSTSVTSLFIRGPASAEVLHPSHNQFESEKVLFDYLGSIAIDEVKIMTIITCTADSEGAGALRCKDFSDSREDSIVRVKVGKIIMFFVLGYRC